MKDQQPDKSDDLPSSNNDDETSTATQPDPLSVERQLERATAEGMVTEHAKTSRTDPDR